MDWLAFYKGFPLPELITLQVAAKTTHEWQCNGFPIGQQSRLAPFWSTFSQPKIKVIVRNYLKGLGAICICLISLLPV